MEIRERIESCLNDLDRRRRHMAEFEERIRALMETLRNEGSTGSSLPEVLQVLGDVLSNYAEIDGNCRNMISALQEIGRNQQRIEDGREKIVGGVEKILGHLAQMEALARQSLGGHGRRQASPEESLVRRRGPARADGGEAKKKKILLIRLKPDTPEDARDELVRTLQKIDAENPGPGEAEEDQLDDQFAADDGPDTVVH